MILAFERRPGQILTGKKVARLAEILKQRDFEQIVWDSDSFFGGQPPDNGPPSPELQASYDVWLTEMITEAAGEAK